MIKILNKIKHYYIVKGYEKWGMSWGDALSYGYLGQCFRFERIERKFLNYESLYTKLGYRQVSTVAFIKYGGYNNKSLFNEQFLVKLDIGELPTPRSYKVTV